MKPYELTPVEDKHEEVLAAPHCVRFVRAGHDSGYKTLLVEAVKRGLAQGQRVLYLTPTADMLKNEDYYWFSNLPEHDGLLYECSIGHLHEKTHSSEPCAPYLVDFAPDLVVIHDPLLSHWPVGRLLKNLRYMRRLNPAMRLLVAGVPYLQPNTSVKRCFWYRLEQQALASNLVGAWHWPSSEVYINRMKDYWDGYIIDRECRALWTELRNHDYGKDKREGEPLPFVSRRGGKTSARVV